MRSLCVRINGNICSLIANFTNMKIRRIWPDNQPAPTIQMLGDEHWEEFTQPIPFVVGSGRRFPGDDFVNCLPFQPTSFRDFMLYEQHAIDAARGYVKRFMPSAYKAVTLYEHFSGRTFPKFKPKPIWYQQPIYYMSNHQTFVPSGTAVRAPSYTSAFDYELELGFVLAKPLLNPTPEEALNAIGAFVVLCDFTARDVQLAEMESGFGPQKAKHFLSSMSEVAVTADEILPRVNQLNATIAIDGKIVKRTSTAGMQHSIGQVLAHAAKDEQLFPGELFGTGTLPGGSGLENGHWLKEGCTLHLTIEGIGEIKHQILGRF